MNEKLLRGRVQGAITFMFGMALLYGALSPVVATPFYARMLFYPDYPSRYDAHEYAAVSNIAGVKKDDVFVAVGKENTKVHGWFFRVPGAKKLVIINHGNAGNVSNRKHLVADFLETGTSVLVYDYRGYGRSEGSASVGNICEDGLAVHDYAEKQLGFSPENIIEFGESLGCAVACNTSKFRHCGGLILLSGFSSLKKISGEKMLLLRAYPTALFPKPLLDNLVVVEGKHPPLLLVHGELDSTVPPSHSRLLFEHATEEKRLVMLPNSGHYVAPEDRELFMQALRPFLADRVYSKQ